MRPARWRRSTHLLVGTVVLAAAALVVAVAGVLANGGAARRARAVAAPPPQQTVKPAVVPVADTAARPTPAGMAAALRQPLANPDLGALTGRVTDALTNSQLWEQGSLLPMMPASTNKVLTAGAALLTLSSDAR